MKKMFQISTVTVNEEKTQIRSAYGVVFSRAQRDFMVDSLLKDGKMVFVDERNGVQVRHYAYTMYNDGKRVVHGYRIPVKWKVKDYVQFHIRQIPNGYGIVRFSPYEQ